MIVALWGWWEVETTIRTGDVVSDLAKPFSYLGFWLARDLGRALYFVAVPRRVPILLCGQVLFGLHWPSSPLAWLALALSVVLATVVSFGWRFLLNLSAFWTTDARGLGGLALSAMMFLGGFVLPGALFSRLAAADRPGAAVRRDDPDPRRPVRRACQGTGRACRARPAGVLGGGHDCACAPAR